MTNKENKNIFSTMKGAQKHWFLTARLSDEISNYSSQPTRLNNLDSKLLEKTAYPQMDQEPLKLEYKIEDKEKLLKELNNKIKVAENTANHQESLSLKAKKQRIEQELRDLYKEYNNDRIPQSLDILEKPISSTKRRKMPIINAIKRFIKRYILAKISKRFKSIVILGDSLETLDTINKNIDELLKIRAPYGETAQNYKKLTEYLYRAHKIRAQISKSVRK